VTNVKADKEAECSVYGRRECLSTDEVSAEHREHFVVSDAVS